MYGLGRPNNPHEAEAPRQYLITVTESASVGPEMNQATSLLVGQAWSSEAVGEGEVAACCSRSELPVGTG